MTSYDSDSSVDDYTETNVLLGYTSKEEEGDLLNHLGGTPDWIDPDVKPSAAFAKCKACNSLMVLLLQLNGELPQQFPGHERRIYVFACRKSSCRRKEGSVRALRGVRVSKEREKLLAQTKHESQNHTATEEAEPKKSGPRLGDTLFGTKTLGAGVSANPFSSNANPFSSSSSSNNPFGSPSPRLELSQPEASKADKPVPLEVSTSTLSKTFAETLSLNAPPKEPPPPPEPWPDAASQPKPYPTLYLPDADYETLDPEPTNIPTNARMEDADAPEPSALDREAFESSMDATFQKFADRLAQNQDQVIRYEFGGVPLLYSKSDAVGAMLLQQGGRAGGMPGCGNCGSRRTFEVQLTPNAIAELEADDMSLEGMEWGTIIVGVCEADCVPLGVETGEVGYKEEWAGVQWEELAKNK